MTVPYVPRLLELEAKLHEKSYFLFGPRQIGKTKLIKNTLSQYKSYNLLNAKTYAALAHNPAKIREELKPGDRIVIVDEIQKLPTLLDEIQLMIDDLGVNFLLTGSSARKLKRSGSNLLGGRARSLSLHPFVYPELQKVGRFDLLTAMNHGLIPSLYFSSDPQADFAAYVGNYLQIEVSAEAAVRNIPAFSRFLHVIAQCNAEMINWAQVSSDAQVAASTVREYFQILVDTFVAYELKAWGVTEKRKPISTSKLYLFDVGLAEYLRNASPIREGSAEFGHAFESWIFHELRSYCDLRGFSEGLRYWRSTSQLEVDFILNEKIAIECKAKQNIGSRDLTGLRALSEEVHFKHQIVVSMETEERKVGAIRILPWRVFLEELWDGHLI